MERIIEVKVFGNQLYKNSNSAGTRGEGNATKLRITFDEGWDEYAKRVVFWDAYGENSTKILLTHETLEDVNNQRVHIVRIPQQATGRAGMLTFCVYGYMEEKIEENGEEKVIRTAKQISVEGKLEVEDTPEILAPENPTLDELTQMQLQLTSIAGGISAAIAAKNAIQNMSVSCDTLSTGEKAYVLKERLGEIVNLKFGLPAGGKGDTGSSGVYIGETKPTDPSVNVWIDTSEDDTDSFAPSMVSVKAFGAKGDGKTNDTEALMAAARSGETVYFPKGTYLLYGQINMSADIKWIGEGEESVIKLMPDENNSVILCHANTGDYSINIQNMLFDANKEAYSTSGLDTTCLYLLVPRSVYLNNVTLTGSTCDGCYVFGKESTGVTIINCRFTNNGLTGQKGCGLLIASTTGARVTNCEAFSNGASGIMLSNSSGSHLSNIVANSNGWNGVDFRSSSKSVLSNIVCSSNPAGVTITGATDNFSEENTIFGLLTQGNTYGVVFGYCDKTVVGGWNCISDQVAYYMEFPNVDRDITGSVCGVLDYVQSEYITNEATDEQRFKVKFIGR